MRRLLPSLVIVAALATACGDEETPRETSGSSTTEAPDVVSSDLADVKVTGEAGTQPTLEFAQPFGVEETATRVVDAGDGGEVAPGAVVTFHFVFVNGRDGKVITTSFDQEPVELVYEDSLMAGIHDGLDGAKAGSRILVAVAPADGLGADPTQGVEETDTLLFFAEILEVRIPLARAEGDAVPPVAGLPTVELGTDGAPTITVPKADPPSELVAQPLIEGRGPVVEAGQKIRVHYTGVLWDGGTEFDSSWSNGESAAFDIGTGGVIAGWDEGLVGRRVGSQVLLVVPPDKGYGEQGRGDKIPPNATLVFVVDILDAG
jgi:peptidylprolyl isomerase